MPCESMMSQNQDYSFEGRIPSIVKLNVGGQYFTTSLQTLTRDPNSMLAAMFSGRHKLETIGDGSFFIDRDGTYFRFILNYLRNGELILPEGATFLAELEAEARFYQVQGLLDELKAIKTLKVLEESVVLTDRYFRNVLIDWISLRSLYLEANGVCCSALLEMVSLLQCFIRHATTKDLQSLL